METTTGNVSERTSPVNLQAAIDRQRKVVVDWEIAVDDARADVDRDLDGLRAAVRERDAATARLADLIKMHDEIEAAEVRFDFEIAGCQAAILTHGTWR